jgi:hypothetical protein
VGLSNATDQRGGGAITYKPPSGFEVEECKIQESLENFRHLPWPLRGDIVIFPAEAGCFPPSKECAVKRGSRGDLHMGVFSIWEEDGLSSEFGRVLPA